MSRAVVAALESTLDALATDAATRVALLRGAGPRGFSAGADISEFPALLEPNADTRGEGIQRLPRAVGPGRARLMIFSGEPISGRRAAEWGLVEDAVGPAEVFDTAAK